jgi:hypothetical protein
MPRYHLPLIIWTSTPMLFLVLSASSAPCLYRGPCSHLYRSHPSQLRSSIDHIMISPPSSCTYFSQPRPAVMHLDFVPQTTLLPGGCNTIHCIPGPTSQPYSKLLQASAGYGYICCYLWPCSESRHHRAVGLGCLHHQLFVSQI